MNKDTASLARKEKGEDRLKYLLDHLGRLLPDAAQRRAFEACSRTPPPPSLRLNPLIAGSQSLSASLAARAQPVPWCSDGYEFPADKSLLSHTLEHAVGAYYLQAKAPMFAVETLAPQPGERVLDLCAAPGGKTTQLAAHMNNSGLLVANEMSKKRLPALVGNLERCGVGNAVVTQAQGTLLARYFHNFFDRILVDAPCSGDGIVRKDLSMLRYWSPEDAQQQAQTQTGLLRAAFHMLRPGGILVYSTCSLSLEENEHVLMALLTRYGASASILPISSMKALPLAESTRSGLPESLRHAVRIWPHLYDTEGAFVARLGKQSLTEWPQVESDAAQWLCSAADDPSALEACQTLKRLWHFSIPRTADQVVVSRGRHLVMQPAASDSIERNLPFFVRAGMRFGRRHKTHCYFTQQAVSLWGHRATERCVDLNWDSVCALFKGERLALDKPLSQRGEVICRHGIWPICRAMVEEEGTKLNGMLPRLFYRNEVQRLT